jgi:hypothetical protein
LQKWTQIVRDTDDSDDNHASNIVWATTSDNVAS